MSKKHPKKPDAQPPYQRKIQLSTACSYPEGRAILEELKTLAYQRGAVSYEEIIPFLDDVERVLVRAGTIVSEHMLALSINRDLVDNWRRYPRMAGGAS